MTKQKSMIICVICVLLAVLMFFLTFWFYQNRHEKLVKAQEEVLQEKQKLLQDMSKSESLSKNYEMVSAEIQKEITGCDRSRVQKDTQSVDLILQDGLTWDSEETYDKARALLQQKFELSDDCYLLTDFFPSKLIYDGDGYEYNMWDVWREKNYNMQYRGMTAYVTDIKDGVYSYYAIVNVSSTMHFDPDEAEDFDTSSLGKCLFTYETTEDGKFQNVNAYILS